MSIRREYFEVTRNLYTRRKGVTISISNFTICWTMASSKLKHCLFSRSTRWVVLIALVLSLLLTYVTDIWRINEIYDQKGSRIISLTGAMTALDNKPSTTSYQFNQSQSLKPTPPGLKVPNITSNSFNLTDDEWDEDELRREATNNIEANETYDFLDAIIEKFGPKKKGFISKEPISVSNRTHGAEISEYGRNETNKSISSNELKEESASDLQQTILQLPSLRAGVNCPGLIAGKKDAIVEASRFQKKNPKITIPDYHYITTAKKCDQFRQERKYISKPLSKEEEEFPIAYSILIFKDIEQFERLLRAIYHPQNYYCVHVDSKSEKDVKKAAKSIVNCFDNVFLSSKSVDVEWGSYSVLEPDLVCMEDLWKYKKWKYFINLTGQEFPLKTNLDLVRILKVYNGANNMEGTRKRRNEDRVVYVHNGFWATEEKLTPIPVNVTITKGSVHITASRAFVDVVLHDPRVQKFKEWVKKTGVPDETFFSSLNHSPHLGIPGAYKGEPETDTSKNLFITRFKNWGIYPFNYPCSGQRVRLVCIFGTGDLPMLAERKELFANKFYLDYQPLTLDCMEELHFNRTRDNLLGKRDFDTSFYKELDFVKNHV